MSNYHICEWCGKLTHWRVVGQFESGEFSRGVASVRFADTGEDGRAARGQVRGAGDPLAGGLIAPCGPLAQALGTLAQPGKGQG